MATTEKNRPDPGTVAKSMNAANKAQISEALIIQTYANSVEEQPQVDFEKQPNLQSYQTSVNDGLTQAKAHASNYLTVIQPEILKNMSNIGNYYAIHDSVATTLPPGSTLAEWNKVLHLLQSKAQTYQREANGTTNLLKTLHTALNQDVSAFATIVKDLNAAVNGDHGVLNSINGQLSSIQDKIDGAIAAVVVSGLSVAGGVFMICVGSITDFVTAGTTTPLVVGGIGMVAGGVGVEITASIKLSNLIDQQASLLTKESRLTSEVKLATGIQGGYASLFKKVKGAASASLKMELTWQTLAGDLGTMISDLNNSLMTADQIRTHFITDANQDVQSVIKDINIIKAQMAGITQLAAKKGNSVSQLIIATAEGNQQPNFSMLMAQFTPKMKAISKSTPATVATKVNNANKHQTSQALIIQNYAISVNEQPMVNFSGEKNLFKYEQEINNGLRTAQAHANNYLNVIQPAIIKNITHIGHYYKTHNSIEKVIKKNHDNKDVWLKFLNLLERKSIQYKEDSDKIVELLQTLHDNLTTDSATFSGINIKLNDAVGGDEGVLKDLSVRLDSIQSNIHIEIGLSVGSALAIAGGGFMVAVGSITTLVTAGTSVPVVVGGVAIIAAGIAGAGASAVLLSSSYNEQAQVTAQTVRLKAEVKLATLILSGYNSLKTQVGSAVNAAQDMRNAWEFLRSDLENLIEDLQDGKKSTSEIEFEMYGDLAMEQIKTVITNINIIKKQMAGVDNIQVPKGETVGQAIEKAVNAQSTILKFEASPRVMNFRSTFTEGASRVTLVRHDSLFANSQLGAGRGTLSKSVANLEHAGDQVRSVGNLPSAAQRILSKSLVNISQMIPQIDAMQTSVGNVVKSSLPQLDQIQKMLKSDEALEKIAPFIENVRGEASSLDATATQVLAAIQGLTSIMYGYFNELYQIETYLINRLTKLQGELGDAQSRESAAKKKYYYLLARLPFVNVELPIALAAIASALALWEILNEEVDGIENDINSLNSQIASVNGMKPDTEQLRTYYQDVVSRVSFVKNTVSLLSNEILEAKSDLSSKDLRILMAVKIGTAIAEVTTLSVDALGSVV